MMLDCNCMSEPLRNITLQEVILNVVTAPSFTNTSESRLDRRAGDTTSLFCHVKGQQLRMSSLHRARVRITQKSKLVWWGKRVPKTHPQNHVLSKSRSLNFTICRRAPTHRDLAESWRSDHLPPARCGSAQLHWTCAAAWETEAKVTRAILVTLMVTHSDTSSGTAATITVWPRMTFPHPLWRQSDWMSCVSHGSWTERRMQWLFQVGPEVRAVRAELLVEVGRTARLGCEVRGYPAPETGWYKDEAGEIRLDKPWLIPDNFCSNNDQWSMIWS